jgi:hypothetical protein
MKNSWIENLNGKNML